jgi:hypothetical protein
VSQKNCESLVAALLDAIETSNYETFLDLPKEVSFFGKWDQSTRAFSERLLLSFLLDHALSLVNEFDDFLDTIEEMEVFEIDSEDRLVLDIGIKSTVKLSQIEHVISAIQYIQSSCLEVNDKNLTKILDLWQESKELSAVDYSGVERIKPRAFSRLKKVALVNMQEDFLHDFDFVEKLNDDEESFYVGGASFTLANLNFSSETDLTKACSICGQNLLVCKSKNCMRSYFFFSTGIDCSVDVYGVAQGDILLVSVSELGGRLARRLSERVPSIIGELKLYKNSQDEQVRLLIGSSFLIDYEDHVVAPGEDYETLIDSSIYLMNPLITEGDYLVVAWQEPWEIEGDSCFMVGLYKDDARRKLEKILR